MNYPDQDAPLYQRAGEAVREWLGAMAFNHFTTFNFNQDTTLRGSKKAIKDFLARWDRLVLGKHFQRQPKAKRTFLIGFVEHIDSNLHYHALVRPAIGCPPYQPNFVLEAPSLWKQLIPSGQLYIPKDTVEALFEKKAISAEHLDRIAAYITKDLKKETNYEHFVISDEFLPSSIR